MTDDDIRLAWRKVEAAHEFTTAIEQKVNMLAARALRLELTRLLEETPELAGFSFATEFNYDDEGSYFRSILITPEFNEAADVDTIAEFEYAAAEITVWNLETAQILFSTTEDAGYVTRESLSAW